MQVRSQRNRRNRSQGDPSKRPVAINATATSTVSANKWRLTFNTPVQLLAVPTADNNGGAAMTVEGAEPTAATQVSPTVIDLTYAVNVAAAQDFVIPNNGKAIRTPSGGYVAAATGTF